MVSALVYEWRKKYSQNYAYNRRQALRLLIRNLQAFGAPTIDVPKVPYPSNRAVTATGDELARLLQSPPTWLRLFILLYLQCGLRRSEALAVTPRSWKQEEHTVTVKVKGGRIRTAQVTDDVEALFQAAGNDPEPETPFIWLLHGRPITHEGIRRAWRKHRDACGVSDNVTAHDLRRTAATILYTVTKDLRIPQQLLGHKSITSTLKYLAPMTPDEARKYHELLRFDKFHSEVKQ